VSTTATTEAGAAASPVSTTIPGGVAEPGGLGALLTIAHRPWYSSYGAAAPLWGLTPLEDQQLAGLVMWVPAGLSYLLATLWIVLVWLRDSERGVVRRERLRAGAVGPAEARP
jgi:cytochrome c oxidase assembly factor CtaG